MRNGIRAYISSQHLCLGIYWLVDTAFHWDVTIRICLLVLIIEVVLDFQDLFDYEFHEWWVRSAYHTPKASIYQVKPAPEDDDDIPF